VLDCKDSLGRKPIATSSANALTYEIITPPQYGTLTGDLNITNAVLTYAPNKDYEGPDSFTYRAKDGSWYDTANTININVAKWTPPIGIPEPTFGIKETHMMYQGQQFDFDGDGVLEPGEEYKDAGNGPYTHYVDASNPLAADGGNPYGTSATPRRTIPANLPAGSVVEVHSLPIHTVEISGIGTAVQPIFVRGPDIVNRTPMNGSVSVGYYANATYIIMENIAFLRGILILSRDNSTVFTNSHIALRNSESYVNDDGGAAGVTTWSQNKIHDVVFYNNIMHDNGVWDPDVAVGDEDYCGIAIGGTYNIWVLDNEMYTTAGMGFRSKLKKSLEVKMVEERDIIFM
jgi:hypothetical protein